MTIKNLTRNVTVMLKHTSPSQVRRGLSGLFIGQGHLVQTMPAGHGLRQVMCIRLQLFVALQNFEFWNHFILDHLVSEADECKSKLLATAELHCGQSCGCRSDFHLQRPRLILSFSYNFASPQSVVLRPATSVSSESWLDLQRLSFHSRCIESEFIYSLSPGLGIELMPSPF